MTTRRFTYKASDATTSLEAVQRRLSAARKKVAQLEQEERNLKGYLIPYFDPEERIDLEFDDGTVMRVTRSQYDMYTMDQEAVKRVFERLKKKVPYNKTVVQKLTVKKVDGK